MPDVTVVTVDAKDADPLLEGGKRIEEVVLWKQGDAVENGLEARRRIRKRRRCRVYDIHVLEGAG